jgi:hypothetical protein
VVGGGGGGGGVRDCGGGGNGDRGGGGDVVGVADADTDAVAVVAARVAGADDVILLVADTIGLCDPEWKDNNAIIELIKGRIKGNFKYVDAVYIVFRADRLLKEYIDNINKVLKWLKYAQGDRNEYKNNTSVRFVFLGTYSDYLNVEQKKRLAEEDKSIFNLENTTRYLMSDNNRSVESLIYTGFPPEEALNELTKSRVQECWEKLSIVRKNPGNYERILIDDKKFSLCSIL